MVENLEVKKYEQLDDSIINHYKYTKQVLIWELICHILFFLLIPLIVIFILNLVWGIKTLLLKTENQDLKNNGIIWGILTILLLGIISIFVYYKQMENLYPELLNIKNKKSY